MRAFVGRIWAALNTERTIRGRKPPRGVALLLVLVALATMAAVVTDFSYSQQVKLTLAMRDRDLLKAQQLARGGAEMGRILLSFQKQIQPMLDFATDTLKIPLPAFTIWQLIPLDSDLLKAFADGQIQEMLGLTIDREEQKENVRKIVKEVRTEGQSTTDESEEKGREGSGYGEFEGSFRVDIQDEDARLSVRGAADQTAQATASKRGLRLRLLALVDPQKYNFLFQETDGNNQRLDRFEFVAAFFDWVDGDRDRVDARMEDRFPLDSAGDEDSLYSSLDDRYRPKNAYFDSNQELRLVAGMDEAKWQIFAPALSIYSDGLVNIRSASNPVVLEGLIASCAEPPLQLQGADTLWLQDRIRFWQYIRTEGLALGMGSVNPEGFVQMLQMPSTANFQGIKVNADRCKASMKTQSEVFTMRVRAEVGEAAVTRVMTLRLFNGRPEYWYFHEE
jgi:type II secretory pathway component PulK